MADPNLTIRQALELALAHHQAGRLPQAQSLYQQILAADPDHADALHLSGVLALQTGHFDLAVDRVLHAIAQSPDQANYYCSLGNIMRAKGDLSQAAACYRQALTLQPNFLAAHNNLGNILQDQDQLESAAACFAKALALQPNFPGAWFNLANVLKEQNLLDQAIVAYRKCLQLQDDFPEAHYHLGLTLLLQGELPEGWREYQWRLHCRPAIPTHFSSPSWDGAPLAGQTILLHSEQGLGDTLQFIRYVPLVAAQGGKILLSVQPELKDLLQSALTVDQWLDPTQPPPPCDLHCSLLSLPHLLGTTLANIPPMLSGLTAPSQDIAHWHEQLQRLPPGKKVGLVWAGNPAHKNDRRRSLPLALLAPLAQVSPIQFLSLQKGAPSAQAAHPPEGMSLHNFASSLHDFSATAALIANLDLVITVDTAVAHLAGSLGKPVWTLLPWLPDWRWLQDRPDTPWYPSMRLFRQRGKDNWPELINRVTEALRQL